MKYSTAYPKHPTIQGALSREVLAGRAVEEGYCFGPAQASDYDILSAAVLYRSKETIQLCLSLRISPFSDDQSSVLNLISFDSNGHGEEPGAVDLLELFIKHKGFEVEKFHHHTYRLMVSAVANNNMAAFDLLVQAGADPYQTNKRRHTILHAACGGDASMKVVETLLTRYPELINMPCNAGGTALTMAAEMRDDPSVVYRLLEAGADPLASGDGGGGLLHGMKWVKYQADGHDPGQIIEELRSRISKEGWEKLIGASYKNLGLPIQTMVRANLCIDFTTVAPGGNVNAFGPGAGEGGGGFSAIGTACLLGQRKSIRRLIEAGADFGNVTAKGHTCWHLWATMADEVEKLRGGAYYYYMLAKENNLKFTRRLFLKTGVSPEALNDDGKHPLAYTDSEEAKLFFAAQRRNLLGAIPSKSDELRPKRLGANYTNGSRKNPPTF